VGPQWSGSSVVVYGLVTLGQQVQSLSRSLSCRVALLGVLFPMGVILFHVSTIQGSSSLSSGKSGTP